jgi:hypothetical protein
MGVRGYHCQVVYFKQKRVFSKLGIFDDISRSFIYLNYEKQSWYRSYLLGDVMVKAKDFEETVVIAKGCPILQSPRNGNVEVRMVVDNSGNSDLLPKMPTIQK